MTGDPRFTFVQGDIADRAAASARCSPRIARRRSCNFAAETHVDRSIDGPRAFVATNVVGTFELLEAARALLHGADLRRGGPRFRFLHVSTDEVYGSLGPTGLFTEDTPYAPNSPYSASRPRPTTWCAPTTTPTALPALVTNCSNNYGPYQFPEKLIPLMILNALEGKPLPVYGDGRNVRDWLYVEDHCAASCWRSRRGGPARSTTSAATTSGRTCEVVDRLCDALERGCAGARQSRARRPRRRELRRPQDVRRRSAGPRPALRDRRARRSARELGWAPAHDFAAGIARTVRWYSRQPRLVRGRAVGTLRPRAARPRRRAVSPRMTDASSSAFPIAPSHLAHPWHGVSPGTAAPAIVTAFIEIVPTDTVKYEVDKVTGHLRVDRPQKYSALCPALYGFVPRTLCGDLVGAFAAIAPAGAGSRGDGDPDGRLRVHRAGHQPGRHHRAPSRPIGGFRMFDAGQADDKILAVLDGDAGVRRVSRSRRLSARARRAAAALFPLVQGHAGRRRAAPHGDHPRVRRRRGAGDRAALAGGLSGAASRAAAPDAQEMPSAC